MGIASYFVCSVCNFVGNNGVLYWSEIKFDKK
jgi:hypothetical protein